MWACRCFKCNYFAMNEFCWAQINIGWNFIEKELILLVSFHASFISFLSIFIDFSSFFIFQNLLSFHFFQMLINILFYFLHGFWGVQEGSRGIHKGVPIIEQIISCNISFQYRSTSFSFINVKSWSHHDRQIIESCVCMYNVAESVKVASAVFCVGLCRNFAGQSGVQLSNSRVLFCIDIYDISRSKRLQKSALKG